MNWFTQQIQQMMMGEQHHQCLSVKWSPHSELAHTAKLGLRVVETPKKVTTQQIASCNKFKPHSEVDPVTAKVEFEFTT